MPNSMGELESTTEQHVEESTIVLAKPTVDYFNYHLNDYCLSEIFKYLSIRERLDVAEVCRGGRWREASQLTWSDIKTLDFKKSSPWEGNTDELPPDYRTEESLVRILHNCGRSLRQLKLQDPADLNILLVIREHCCNLTRLDINIIFCETDPAELILSQQKLEYLRIIMSTEHLSADFFEALPNATLTEIHLIISDAGPPYPFYMILPHIAVKILKELTKLTAISLEGFTITPDILQVITEKNQLTYLSLANCAMKMDLSPLNQLINLEHLDLSRDRSVNDELIMGISRNCEKLGRLKLNCCENITDRGIWSLAALYQLEELSVFSNPKIRGFFLSELHHLRKLDVCCCPINDEEIISFLENAIDLEYLNVSHTNISEKVLKMAGRMTRDIEHPPLELIVTRSLKYNWQSRAARFPLLTVDVQKNERDGYNRFYSRRMKKRQERQRRCEKHRLKISSAI